MSSWCLPHSRAMKKCKAAGHQIVATAAFDQNTTVGQDIIPLLSSLAPVIVSSVSFPCFLRVGAISSQTPRLLVLAFTCNESPTDLMLYM